ncbi:MAG: TolC family protein [Puniceicoccales bacterium]|jgi:outer membrane protein TolC|nr:TolC family protein [Puniceicoccales bacterium]
MKFFAYASMGILLLGGCRSIAVPGFQKFHRADIACAGTSHRNGEMPLRLPHRTVDDVIGKIDLDLTMLMEVAFQNNSEVRRAWLLAQAAAAQKSLAKSSLFPTVNMAFSLRRDQGKNAVADGELAQFHQTSLTNPALQLNYAVFTFGANLANAQAAQENLSAANFQYNRSLQDLLFAVQRGYFSMSSAMATMDASGENLRDATETMKFEEERLRVGLGDRQTFLQAKASMLQAQCALEMARADVEARRAALAATVGVRISDGFHISPSKLPLQLEALEGDIQKMISAAINTRPDLLASYMRVKAMQCGERALRRDRLPKVITTLDGKLGETRHGHGTSRAMGIFFGLSWDLFDGFAHSYRIMEQRAQKQAAIEALRSAELRVMEEIWSQYHAFHGAYHRVLAAREWVNSAAESFRAMEMSHRSGLSHFIDLLNAQNVLAAARQNLVAAECDFSIALATLAHATGSMEPLKQ